MKCLGKSPAGWAIARSLPAVLLALLPKCPLCWVAYGTVLGAAGGYFEDNETIYGLLIGLVWLIALVPLAMEGRRRKNYLPLYLAVVSSLITLAGAYAWEIRGVTVVGIFLFGLSLAWGGGRLRERPRIPCCSRPLDR